MKKIKFCCFHCFVAFTIVMGFSYCRKSNNYPKEIMLTLNFAGSNANELRAVLDHYANDSLEYKAACFLISNMQKRISKKLPGQVPEIIKSSFTFLDSLTRATYFRWENDEFMEFTKYLDSCLDTNDYQSTQDIVDSLVNWKFGDNPEIQKFKFQAIHFRQKSDSIREILLKNISSVEPQDGPFFDAQHIKSKWLISHINNAFSMWHESPFAKNMSFDEFAETLLSYRSFDEAVELNLPSDSCRSILQQIVGAGRTDIGRIVRDLNIYLNAMDCMEDEGRNLGYLGFYDILQLYKYDCDRHSEWTVKMLNACGIPASLDFTTGFFIRNKMHFGVSVRDVNGKYHHFTPKWQPIDDTAHSKLFSKVFRTTFRSQKNSPASLKQTYEETPQIFLEGRLRDVSDEYHKVTTISIPYTQISNAINLAYLAIFTTKGWKPIGWGDIDRNAKTLTFQKVPVDAIYAAGYYDSKNFQPVSQPFLIDKSANLTFFKPNYEKTADLHLIRKYPPKTHIIGHMLDMVGSSIEAANNRDFSDAVVIHILTSSELEDFDLKAIAIHNHKKFRFVRVVPPKGKMLHIAFLDFFTNLNSTELPSTTSSLPYVRSLSDTLMRDTVGLKKIVFNFLPNSQNVEKLVDENMESFAATPHLEVDFMKAQVIKQIRIAPRNANNEIVAGNEYRLYYYDRTWKIKGSQVAKYNFLDFKGLPSGTMYWLQNVDGGKEELPFIYREKRQVFINNNEPVESSDLSD
ncbi:MAG: hypothetical protein QM768_13535 [Agriterribacter sp.]